MIYALYPQAKEQTQVRLLAILGFAVLTGIGARLSIPMEPVPITFQVLAALLAGLVLGWQDGFLSQMAYIGLILAGVPIDARYLGGMAAFQTPSTGYILAFPVAAAVVGLLVIRENLWVRLAASFVGVAVIYLIGATYLKIYLNVSWSVAWAEGVAPFIVVDLGKALLAAASTEGARRVLFKNISPEV